MAKFGNVSEVDLFFVSSSRQLYCSAKPSSSTLEEASFRRKRSLIVRYSQANTRSQSQSRIYYIGFMGETRQLKKEPGDRLTGSSSRLSSILDADSLTRLSRPLSRSGDGCR